MTIPMVMLQQMPGIWDKEKFYTFRHAVLGELAAWAIRQSPYLFPDDLQEGLKEFDSEFPKDPANPSGIFQTDCDALEKSVKATFLKCPVIMGWNNPKVGEHNVVFVDRFSEPEPDHDFIDLDALAKNVAHSITVLEKFEKAHG